MGFTTSHDFQTLSHAAERPLAWLRHTTPCRRTIGVSPRGANLLAAEVRTVEIVGLDLQADGGTHVVNTSEVRDIRVVDYKSKGKIDKGIEVALDE